MEPHLALFSSSGVRIASACLAFTVAWSFGYGFLAPYVDPELMPVAELETLVGTAFVVVSFVVLHLLLNREARRRLSALRQRAALGGVEDHAYFMLDRSGRLTEWTANLARAARPCDVDVAQFPYERFFTPEDRAAGLPHTLLARAAVLGRFDSFGWRLRIDGSRHWAQSTVQALFDDDGRLRGYACINHDLGEAAVLSIRRTTPQWRGDIGQCHLGEYLLAYDLASDTVALAEHVAARLGLQLDSAGRTRLVEFLTVAIRDVDRFDVVLEGVRPAGGTRLVHSTVEVVRGLFGRPERTCWTTLDPMERATPALTPVDRLGERPLAHHWVTDASITLDAQHRILHFNAVAEAMFRTRRSDAIGKSLGRFLLFESRREGERAAHQSAAPDRINAVRALRADGEEFAAGAAVSRVTLGDQQVFNVTLRESFER